MKKTIALFVLMFMGLTASNVAADDMDDDMMMNSSTNVEMNTSTDSRMMNSSTNMNTNASMNSNMMQNKTMMDSEMRMNMKSKVEMKLDEKVSNLTQAKVNIILSRVDAYRNTLDASSMSDRKKMAYNMVLDVLVEVLRERENMMGDNNMMNDDMNDSDMDSNDMSDERSDMNIVEAASAKAEFSMLVDALTTADLADMLMEDGPFTVFAPSNDAFEKVDSDTLEMLMEEENMDMLKDILSYHVVMGEVTSDMITDGATVETAQGQSLTFSLENGMVMINGNATVTMADMKKSNGVVHKIDMVLMPDMNDDMSS